jgi:hypothetical protein
MIDIGGLPPDVYVSSIKYEAKEVLAPGSDIDVRAFDNSEFFKQYQSRATRVVLENAGSADLNLRVIAP